ncbi:hypothetical protein B9Z55_001940 [Caenorhabditis nigoni]|nr:hypothetical protein B9Z55_001940 [Caenorhabditis nigoni]
MMQTSQLRTVTKQDATTNQLLPTQDDTKQGFNQVLFLISTPHKSETAPRRINMLTRRLQRVIIRRAQQKLTNDKEEEMQKKSSFNELSFRSSETSPEDVNEADDKNAKKTSSFQVNSW